MDPDQDSNQDEAPSWASAAAPEEPRRAAGRGAPRGPPPDQERAAWPLPDRPRGGSPPRHLHANLNEAFPWHEAHHRAEPMCHDPASPWALDQDFDRAASQHRTDPLSWAQGQRDRRFWDEAPAGSHLVDQEDERGGGDDPPRDWRDLDPSSAGQRGGSPQLRARRRLFPCPPGARGSTVGAPDVRQQLRSVAERDRLKWNFDFESERPLPGGDFAWEAVPAASVCAFYRPVNLRRAGKRVSDNVSASSSSSSSSSCPTRVSSSSSASSSSSSTSSSSPSSANVSPEPSGPGPGPPSSREASRGGRGGGGGGGDGGGGGVGDATGSPTGRECSVTCVPRKRSKLSGSRRRANPALCASRTTSPAARGSTT